MFDVMGVSTPVGGYKANLVQFKGVCKSIQKIHFASMSGVGQKIFGDESTLFFFLKNKHLGQAKGKALAGVSLESLKGG